MPLLLAWLVVHPPVRLDTESSSKQIVSVEETVSSVGPALSPIREHTPLCSSSAKYTNEKPPSPSTLTILTIIIEARQSCDTSNVYNAHVRPLILTFADCWHTQDDSAQKASLIWYLMLSSVL